jgi:hypothetical protein
MRKALLAIMALCLITASAALAANTSTNKMTKQSGGSTGDSAKVAPDTSSAIRLPTNYTGLFVIAANDSATSYRTQVSYDNSSWFTADFDTCAIASAEATADLGSIYGGFYLRVITDNLSAAGADYGASWVVISK